MILNIKMKELNAENKEFKVWKKLQDGCLIVLSQLTLVDQRSKIMEEVMSILQLVVVFMVNTSFLIMLTPIEVFISQDSSNRIIMPSISVKDFLIPSLNRLEMLKKTSD